MSALPLKADMCGATGDVRFWDRFRVVRMIEWNKGVVRRVRLDAGLCTDL